VRRPRRAVIIGAGLGGLAAAARLQAKGYETVIIERNSQVGGRAHTFNKDGRVYDAGPTVVTAPYLFEELFQLFGERLADYVEFLPVEPYYRYSFPDGDNFDYSCGDLLHAEIERVAPGELENYFRFLELSKTLFKRGYEQLGDRAFTSPFDMLRELPFIVQTRSFLSLYQLCKRFFKSEKLRQVFSTPSLLVGGSPLETPAIYGLIHALEQKWGVWFARGGTGNLIHEIEALLIRNEVQILKNRSVTEITTKRGRVANVVLSDGEKVVGDLFVSNLDPAWLYSKILSNHGTLQPKHFSFGLFVQFFAVKQTYKDVAHHTIILQNDYAGALKRLTKHGILDQKPNLYLH